MNATLFAIRTFFPSIPLFLTLGNNDVFPDYYDPSEGPDALHWRTMLAAIYMANNVTFDSASYLKSGFSATTLRLSATSSLRILSLNSVCVVHERLIRATMLSFPC